MTSAVGFLLRLTDFEIFFAYEYENANSNWHFRIYRQKKIHAQLSLTRKKRFITFGPVIIRTHLPSEVSTNVPPIYSIKSYCA